MWRPFSVTKIVIGEELIGKVSPRAYVSCTYSDEKIPLPVQFIETVENSLEEVSQRLVISCS